MARGARKFALDTSVFVPLVAAWHEHHQRATRAVDARLQAGWRAVVPANVLLETFAVLTRLPTPYRVSAQTARAAVEAALPSGTLFAAITPADCHRAMEAVESQSLAGGKVYDAAIAQCAGHAGATVLLSFDAKDHVRLAVPPMEVTVPEGL